MAIRYNDKSARDFIKDRKRRRKSSTPLERENRGSYTRIYYLKARISQTYTLPLRFLMEEKKE